MQVVVMYSSLRRMAAALEEEVMVVVEGVGGIWVDPSSLRRTTEPRAARVLIKVVWGLPRRRV